MERPQLLILQACNGTAGDDSGFVLDADIARRTGLSLSDVRDHLTNLEHGDFISLVRLARVYHVRFDKKAIDVQWPCCKSRRVLELCRTAPFAKPL